MNVRGDVTLAYRLDALEPSAPKAPLIICLHGWGMDEDWFARLLGGLGDLPANLLYLRAPSPVDKKDGKVGWSWYVYNGDAEHFVAELEQLEERLLHVVRDVEMTQNLSPTSRVLIGFSQGAYGGSFAAVRNPGVFSGLVVSGARVKDEALRDFLPQAAEQGLRVLGCHGRKDEHVDLERSKASLQSLEKAGIEVTWLEFDAGHSMGRQQVAAVADWIGQRFTSDGSRRAESPTS